MSRLWGKDVDSVIHSDRGFLAEKEEEGGGWGAGGPAGGEASREDRRVKPARQMRRRNCN